MQIKLELTRTQMEVLMDTFRLALEDVKPFGIYTAPIMKHHLEKLMERLKGRLGKATPGRKSSLTLTGYEGGVLMICLNMFEFNRSTESALIRGIAAEVDSYF